MLVVPAFTADDEREWGELAKRQQEELKERTRDRRKYIEAKSTEEK